MLTRHLIPLLVLGFALVTSPPAAAADAEPAPLASRALLLDGQVVSEHLVAVGERGHILVSTDAGRSWQQRPVPTRVTLTSVWFADDRYGWAAGHDATILRTTDGGVSWQKVYDDPAAAVPILDLWFRDATTGYAVGAYGLLLTTTDGGLHWESTPLPAEDGAAIDLHLNQLRAFADGRPVIAAEAGHLFIAGDKVHWQSLPVPYAGSMFGTLPLGGDRILAYGLRGHLFLSIDAGRHWRPVVTGTDAILNDAIRLHDGRLVVVGLAGTVLLSSDAGENFTLLQQPDRAGIARVLETSDKALLLLGTMGARRLEIPAGGPP